MAGPRNILLRWVMTQHNPIHDKILIIANTMINFQDYLDTDTYTKIS